MTPDSLPPHHMLARRTVLQGASLGVGAGLMSGLTAAAQAQTTGTGVAQAEDGPIWSAEYWAKKGDVSLNLWRKRVAAPKPQGIPHQSFYPVKERITEDDLYGVLYERIPPPPPEGRSVLIIGAAVLGTRAR